MSGRDGAKHFSDRLLVESLSQFLPAGFDEDGPIWEDDGRHTAVAVVDLYDEFGCFAIPFEIDAQVRNVVRLEEFFRAVAIGAVFGYVHDNLGGCEGAAIGHGVSLQ